MCPVRVLMNMFTAVVPYTANCKYLFKPVLIKLRRKYDKTVLLFITNCLTVRNSA